MTTYEQAGVDLAGATGHVESIASTVTSTWSNQVVGAFGGFAAGVEIPDRYERPVLMMSTDGVGTKLELARRSGIWSGVGHDLVAMCVDDLAAAGAEPLGFVDYMAVGALDPERDTEIVASIAAGCTLAGCPLLGGETAEHPGVMDADAVDLAGAAMGVLEHGSDLDPGQVRPGDLVLGLHSPNVRSNGFSLIRAVFGDQVDDHAETLLEPSVIYAPDVAKAIFTRGVKSAAHITGGGLAENLQRALPEGLGAQLNTTAWDRPEVFSLIEAQGVPADEMWSTFNMGIGFCLVVDPAAADDIAGVVQRHKPAVIGSITTQSGISLG